MSYDLCFWKQAGDHPGDSRSTYLALIGGSAVEGVEPFPIDEFVAGVEASFPGVRREQRNGNQIYWLDGDETLVFEMSWSDAHVLATLRPLDESVANRLIDVGVSLRAPLYDPQINERFALP